MIDIKDISERIKLSTEIGEGSIRRFELMKEDYVQPKFSLADPVYFGIGDSVEVEGEPFYITKLMYPSFNTSNAGYDYELRFDSHYFRWRNHTLFYDRQGNKESSWKLTRSPEAHLGIVVSNIRALGFKYKGLDYQAVVDSTVDTSAKLVEYDNTNIIDALTKIAETWECEWWVDGDKIYLGKCEHGEPIDLEIGKEISSMTRSQSKETYANRIYAFGSTRNIPTNYRSNTGDGSVVEGVVTKRLMLPVGIDHIDVIEGLKDSEVVDRVVVFDKVYPRTTCTITSVETKEVTDKPEGSEPETYTVYRFRDSNFHFSSKYILPNEELRIVFQYGPLSGFDFAVTFNPDKASEDTEAGQVFEIVRNQDYGQWLPADPLKPTVGSQFILYGFDTQFISDQLLGNAEQELLEEAQAFVKKLNVDPSTYNCVVNSYLASGYDEKNGVLNPDLAINMTAGQKVNLINQAYFKNGRVSRVIGFEKKLDIPYDSPTYIIGESSAYSRIGELEEKIDNIQFKGNTYVNQGGGGNIYVIKKEDPTAASDENVFSSLRTLEEIRKSQVDFNDKYLRKDMNDTGHGFYEWEAGWMTQAPVRSAEYNIGWEVESPTGWYVSETGSAWYTSLNVRGPILSNNVIGSPYYVSGWTGYGSQWDMVNHRLETDYVSVRKELKVYALDVFRIYGTNGDLAVSTTNKIDRVEDMGSVWRLHIEDYDGEMYMNMRIDDVVRCQTWEKKSGRYYMGYVTNIDEKWFEISKNLLEGTTTPAKGDVLVRWSNLTNNERKGLLYLSASDSYAPYMDVRFGDWNVTIGTIKVRNGRLDGINDPLFPELYGAVNNFGLYTSNFYGTGELILRSTGESVSRTFEILKDSMTMGFNELREEVYVSPDNVLQNSTFLAGTTDYWEYTNVAYPLTFANNIMLANGSLFSDLVSGAQIVKDSLNSRTVLQVTNTVVRQRNINFNSRSAGKYAISFSYRPIVPFGLMTVGIEGSTMMVTVPLSDTSKWQRAEVTGDWDGTKDFVIQVTGGGIVNIVDISFADDRITNAISNLKVEYDTKLTLKADQAQMNSFRDVYDEFERVVRRDYATQTWTATKINSEVGTIIDGRLTNYSTISQTSTMINNKVADLNLGQYATTTWTSNQIRNEVGNIDLSQYAKTQWTKDQITNAVSNKADKGAWNSDLTQTAQTLTATFTEEIKGVKGVTQAFYSFDVNHMRLNRRIEMGTGPDNNFTCNAGFSPDTNNAAFWIGSSWNNQNEARIRLNHDGSGWLAGKNIIWDTAGNSVFRGTFESSSSGNRFIIDPYSKAFKMYNSSNQEVTSLSWVTDNGVSNPTLTMNIYAGSTNTWRSVLSPGVLSFISNGIYMGGFVGGVLKLPKLTKKGQTLRDGTVYRDDNNHLIIDL